MEIIKIRVKLSISRAIFLITILVAIISLMPAVFPALILRSLGGLDDHMGVNPFETSSWFAKFLIINAAIFGMTMLYFKNKLPKFIVKPIKFLFNFETSSQITFLVMAILIGTYTSFHVGDLFTNKFEPDYYGIFKPWLESFTITHFHEPSGLNDDIGHYLQLVFETFSMKIFGNYKVVPFVISIVLLVLTYLVTSKLSKKRFAGIIATVILLQSGIFLSYDTSVSYTNLWMMFYLLSIYLTYGKWFLSPVAFFAGIFSKGLTLTFFPMTLFFIYKSEIKKRTKLYLVVGYFITIAFLFVLLSVTDVHLNPVSEKKFSLHDFWSGFNAFYSSAQLDGLVLIFLLPLTVGLFLISKQHVHADSIIFFIMTVLLFGPFLSAFSDNQNVPYRYICLIIFFAIGVGLLLSKRTNEQSVQFPSLHKAHHQDAE